MAFQRFFERNPSFLPGARGALSSSGHHPFSASVISQPQIGPAPMQRIPDFVWLAQDSTSFTPVFIEIEQPSKIFFTQKKQQTSDFSQALTQINEWQIILNDPLSRLHFYDEFKIPDYIKEKAFLPKFVLIYGRRREFSQEPLLQKKITQIAQNSGASLMSYDRLSPNFEFRQMLCTKIIDGKYKVITIPPTFQYRPAEAVNFTIVSEFSKAILEMEHTSPERKNFLLERFPYWNEYGRNGCRGVIHSADRE